MSTPLTFTLPPELVEEVAQRAVDILEQRAGAYREPRRWLTVNQAAEYIGSKPKRIYDLRSSGRLSRTGDGSRALVDRQELDRLVRGMQ